MCNYAIRGQNKCYKGNSQCMKQNMTEKAPTDATKEGY